MKCLVIGAGGVGGSLAALLALAGNEVTCVARGEHKEKMLAHGLRFHSGIKGEQVVPCYVYDGTEDVRERLVWLRPKLIGGRPS